MILIKKATIICEHSPYHHLIKDILIENGKIIEIADKIERKSTTKIERENLHVSIGWIDSGVSFGTPGYEERQNVGNAIKTTALSGFTSVMLNPNNSPNPENKSGVNSILSYYKNDLISFYPVGSLSKDQKGEHLAELYDMYHAGAVSFYDFKNDLHNANLLKVALQYSTSFNTVLQSFPQDGDIAGKGMVNEDENNIHLGIKSTPEIAEILRVSRDITIAEYTGGRLHIPTVTSAGALQLIKEAKEKSLKITCSVAAHHLLLNSKSLVEFETSYKVEPPLRDEETRKKLQEYVLDGTVDCITSDHTPVTIESKNVEFEHADYGTIGLESCFGVVNQLFDMDKTIEQLTSAYKIFNLETPLLEIGSTAVLTLFDPSPEYEFGIQHIHSTSKNSAMLGQQLKGKVYGIINGNNHHLND
jgi:dihydroorotase